MFYLLQVFAGEEYRDRDNSAFVLFVDRIK